MGKESSFAALAREYIENSEYFEDASATDLDGKHTNILKSHYENFDVERAFGGANFRNWKSQTDLVVPTQLFAGGRGLRGLSSRLRAWIRENTFERASTRALRRGLLDDLRFVRAIGGDELLAENPVALSPGGSIHYSHEGLSFNLRWLRYVYLATRILQRKLLPDNGSWLDVGPYYGGLQGMVLKKKPRVVTYLVDFNHQLCRCYIYLKTLFPDREHILPARLGEAIDPGPGAIVYVPVSRWKAFANSKFSLATNFVSFGEMKTDTFLEYYHSTPFRKSERVFMVNRFVSAPYFSPTYDSNTTVAHYLDQPERILSFDVFPIHHTLLVPQELYGNTDLRPISSQYFEAVLKPDVRA